MKISSSRRTTAARRIAFAVLAAAAIAAPGAGGARAQETTVVAVCRSIDYAFADQERDYYAFYAFDRSYGAPGDGRPACGAAPTLQELAAKR